MRKKTWIKLLAACLCVSSALAAAPAAFAAEGGVNVQEIAVSNDARMLSDVIANPVDYTENVSGGMLNDFGFTYNQAVSNKAVLYTASFPFTTTKRGNVAEYTLASDGSDYRVTGITDGDSYIPVGGLVLSLPKGEKFDGFAAVGDKLKLTVPKDFFVASKAVECKDTGVRIAVDQLNGTRSRPMVAYYDYQYGKMTGTNQFGTEMVATYDRALGKFVVSRFRAFGEGSQSGIPIPNFSFVLSAYGTPYRGFLMEGKKFRMGDKLELMGFDFVRTDTQVTGNFDFINPTYEDNPLNDTDGSEFPGYRGPDQTVIYRHGWSYKDLPGTGTNVYGFEAAVDKDGVVVERGVNVSKIPEGGYVISGHGKGRDFITANVTLGSTVALDENAKTYTVYTTLNSYFTNVKQVLFSAISYADNRIEMLYDIDREAVAGKITAANAEFEKLETVIGEINSLPEDTDKLTRDSLLMDYNEQMVKCEEMAYDIQDSAMESRTVSARAVWHRPNIVGTETTLDGIRETLRIFKDCNINLILVESFYNGMSMFRSDKVAYHSSFTGYTYGDYPDYLTAFTAEAAKLGIEVHAWVENFYVGLDKDCKILTDHPDWVLYNDDGSVYQRNEGGAYVFIDPANPAVQDFLAEYYLEMLQKVPGLSGINLDYIRYPVLSRSEDVGYTKYAMLEFSKSLGKELADNASLTNNFKKLFNPSYNLDADENYAEWVSYRTGKVTEFVKELSAKLRKQKPDLLLSTAVFASVSDSRDKKMQDWQTWFKNGYIDVATPMAYYDSAVDVMTKVRDMIALSGENCYNYAGLASSYRGLPAYETANQIDASFMGGANGFVIFASQNLLPDVDVQKVLKSGVSSAPAVLPHASPDKVLAAVFDGMLEKADRLYIPAGGMTSADKTRLTARLEQIKALPTATGEQLYAVIGELQKLYDEQLAEYAAGYSLRRLQEETDRLIGIMNIQLSRKMINSGEWDPEEQPVRPVPGGIEPSPDPSPGQSPTPEPENQRRGCACGSLGYGGGQGWGGMAAILAVTAAILLCVKKKSFSIQNKNHRRSL